MTTVVLQVKAKAVRVLMTRYCQDVSRRQCARPPVHRVFLVVSQFALQSHSDGSWNPAFVLAFDLHRCDRE